MPERPPVERQSPALPVPPIAEAEHQNEFVRVWTEALEAHQSLKETYDNVCWRFEALDNQKLNQEVKEACSASRMALSETGAELDRLGEDAHSKFQTLYQAYQTELAKQTPDPDRPRKAHTAAAKSVLDQHGKEFGDLLRDLLILPGPHLKRRCGC